MLLDCPFLERNKVNGDGLTFLDILRNLGQNEGGWDLDLEQVVLTTGYNEATSDFRNHQSLSGDTAPRS